MRGTMERMYSDLMDGLTFTVFECNSDGYWRAGRRGLGSSVAGVNGYSSGLINEQFFSNNWNQERFSIPNSST